MVRGTSSAARFDIYEPAKVLWLGYMEVVVCNGDDLILNPLFNFEPMKGLEHWRDVRMFRSEPMKGLEHWGDVRMFRSVSNSSCKSVLNKLKALNLSDG